MYAKLEEVTLVHPSKYRPVEGDRPIYERGLNGDRVFTFDPEPSQYDSAGPKRYGLGYIGPNGDVCIVPDLWDENDSWIARNTVRPDWLIFNVNVPIGDVLVDRGEVYVKTVVGERYNQFEAIEVNGVMFRKEPAAHIAAGPVVKEADLPSIKTLDEVAFLWGVRDLEGRWYVVADYRQPEG